MRFLPRTGSLLVTLAALLIPLPAIAQDKGKSIKFRVLCLEHQEDILEAQIASGSSDGTFEVPLLTGNFSEEFKASFVDGMVYLFIDDATAPDGRRVIASGKLSTSDQQVFLLLPDPTKKMPYRITAMNDDEKSFPMGAVRILNLCSGPVRFNFAGANMKPIAPNRSVVYPPVRTVDEWGMYQVRIDYATPDGKWVPVATPSWKGTKLKRDLVITMLDPRTKQPRISYYKDIPPWRKPTLVVPE